MPLSDLETGLGIRLALSATTQRIFVFQGEIVSMLSTDRWAAAKWPPSGLPASLPGPVARDRGRRRRLGSFVCRPKQNRRHGQQENSQTQGSGILCACYAIYRYWRRCKQRRRQRQRRLCIAGDRTAAMRTGHSAVAHAVAAFWAIDQSHCVTASHCNRTRPPYRAVCVRLRSA